MSACYNRKQIYCKTAAKYPKDVKSHKHHSGSVFSRTVFQFSYCCLTSWTHINLWSSQQHCFWSSGRDIGLPMCANGKCLIGVKRRYDQFYTLYPISVIPAQCSLEYMAMCFFKIMFNCRRNWSWKLWTTRTVNQKNISTPICAALWFWSVSQLWWVTCHFYSLHI